MLVVSVRGKGLGFFLLKSKKRGFWGNLLAAFREVGKEEEIEKSTAISLKGEDSASFVQREGLTAPLTCLLIQKNSFQILEKKTQTYFVFN